MSSRRSVKLPGPTESRFDVAIGWLLIAMMVFAPLALGSVDAWSEEVILLLGAAIALVLSAKLILQKDASFVWSWTYLPVGLFLALIVLQLTPIPGPLLRCLSPNAFRLQSDSASLFAQSNALSHFTLSLYPAETRRELSLILVLCTVFVAAINSLHTRGRIIRLLLATGAIGLVEALINILQFASGTHKVLWLVPMENLYSGTFAGHANFGQFINLCAGAMIGLIAYRFNKLRTSEKKHGKHGLVLLLEPKYRTLWILIAGVCLLMSAMCLSNTRGGMMGAALAAMLTLAILSYRKRRQLQGKSWYFIMGVLAVAITLLCTGFDSIYDRLATLGSFQIAKDARPQIARDLLQLYERFPLFGTGLGTHATVYPMVQTLLVGGTAYTADNQYAQVLEETGFVGVAIILGFLALITIAFIKVIRKRSRPIRSVAYGIGFGLIAILVQSATDFGQQIPSIACITALFCAILIILARQGDPSAEKPAADQSPSPSVFAGAHRWVVIPRLALLPLTLLIFGLLLVRADRDRRAEAAWKDTLVIDKMVRDADWKVGNNIYNQLISNAADAANLKPDDVRYAYWLAIYRWQSVARPCDDVKLAASLLNTRLTVAPHVINDLLATTRLCPTYAAPYASAAQIVETILQQPVLAIKLMDQAHRLAPNDPSILMSDALLNINLGNNADAAGFLKTAVTADRAFLPRSISLMLAQNRPDLAESICGDDVDGLIGLLSQMPVGTTALPATSPSIAAHPDANAILANQVRSDLIAKIIALCNSSDVDQYPLARFAQICLEGGNAKLAADYYQRALAKDYSQVDWRMGLAHALVATGQTDAAMSELRACKRLAPLREDIRDYMGQIAISPHRTSVDSVISQRMLDE